MPMLPNIVLVLIVGAFWAGIYSRARRVGMKSSLNLMILPLFFVLVGGFINRSWPWYGTIIVGGIHAVLQLVLSVKRSRGGL